MGIFSTLKSLDGKFSWSFFGFVIGIVGVGYAIYVEHFKDESPKLVFDILSNTQVLSVNEDVNNLDILYNGQNLKEQKENLILLTIRIGNFGNGNIRESDYFSASPFGLTVNGGKIVETPVLIDASGEFIKKNIMPNFDTLNRITFNKIPFDKGESFTIKILTICKENIVPTIAPFGKISGITDRFVVKSSFKETQANKKSFFESLIEGSAAIHLVRLFCYVLIFVIIIVIALSLGTIPSKIRNLKRLTIIKKYKSFVGYKISTGLKEVFIIYKLLGSENLVWLKDNLNDSSKLLKIIETHNKYYFSNESDKHDIALDGTYKLSQYTTISYSDLGDVINRLIKFGIININKDSIEIDDLFLQELERFIDFLNAATA